MFLKFQVCFTRYAAAYFYVLSYLILIIIFDAMHTQALGLSSSATVVASSTIHLLLVAFLILGS